MKQLPPNDALEREVARQEIRVRQLRGLVDVEDEIDPSSERARMLRGELAVAEEMIRFLRRE